MSNSPLDDIHEYKFDTVWIKFTNLKHPTPVVWIELASGIYVAEESTPDELVFLTKKIVPVAEENIVSPETADDSPEKTHLKKADLIHYLESKLRPTPEEDVVDYGPIEDIRMQPAGREMTKEVYQFLLQYGVR